eukprot:Pgem_evm1s13000
MLAIYHNKTAAAKNLQANSYAHPQAREPQYDAPTYYSQDNVYNQPNPMEPMPSMTKPSSMLTPTAEEKVNAMSVADLKSLIKSAGT